MQAWRNLFTLFILIMVLDKATIYGDLVRMTYKINILSKAQRYFDTLDERTILNIWSSIAELKKNPYRRRPLVDIIKLRGFKSPPMYRLRVGRHRLEYFIDENENAITVTNAFLRSGDSDYR
jgi:mRNA-degrading endonuclease RelE of RelBE toxin-antitoxin system